MTKLDEYLILIKLLWFKTMADYENYGTQTFLVKLWKKHYLLIKFLFIADQRKMFHSSRCLIKIIKKNICFEFINISWVEIMKMKKHSNASQVFIFRNSQ